MILAEKVNFEVEHRKLPNLNKEIPWAKLKDLTTSISCDSLSLRRTVTASETFTTGLTSLL